MRFEDQLKVFQFTEDWVSLGLINPQLIEELWEEYVKGNDPNLEHFRWSAFTRYLNNAAQLDGSTMRELYNLSLRDADTGLKIAMVYELVHRDEFPPDLLEQLTASEYPSLANAAKKRIERDQR